MIVTGNAVRHGDTKELMERHFLNTFFISVPQWLIFYNKE
jgi:hypothetical protein